MKFLIISTLFISSFAAATVSDIQKTNSGQRYSRTSDLNIPSVSSPGYQTTTLGDIWRPKLDLANTSGQPASINLDNATGQPAIDLSRSTGDISGTKGINSAIRDSINESNKPSEPPPTKWTTVWTGSTTGSISLPSGKTEARITMYLNLQRESTVEVHSYSNSGRNMGFDSGEGWGGHYVQAWGKFNGDHVHGGSQTKSWECGSSNHSRTCRVTAQVNITKIEVR
ncbi:hypothetical protein ACPV5U_24435 [Vibrio mediterranei]